MDVFFATGNLHKIQEINNLIPNNWRVRPISELGFTGDIPEHGDTLEANAKEKVQFMIDHYGVAGFAEDTGLEVAALNGRPGVYSARYAGDGRSATANMEKVLLELANTENRSAQFRTVIALYLNDTWHLFEGIVKGMITQQPMGEGGFGYDPIFQPEGYTETFGQLPAAIKQTISHRARAMQQLIAFLSAQ